MAQFAVVLICLARAGLGAAAGHFDSTATVAFVIALVMSSVLSSDLRPRRS